MIVLASASPRRRELLERVGFAVTVDVADVDETQRPGEAPLAYVQRVAGAKADLVAARRPAGTWVLAADTIVACDGDVLGKAASAVEADAMLRRLVGRSHEVTTAFAIRGAARHDAMVTTVVTMVAAAPAVIADYVSSDEWRGKAGAYAVQGIGAALVERVHGSVTGVIGLPLPEVIAALRALGGPAPAFSEGYPA